MQTVVHVHERAGDPGRERRAQERGGLANLHRRQRLLAEGRVGHGVVDHVVDEADGLRGARAEGARGDGVDADAPLAARLVREHLRVGLERRLRGAHAAAVAGDDLLRGEVGERDGGAALVHDGPEALQERHLGVGGRGERGKVAVARGFQERLLHLGAVGERVHEDVDGAEVLLHLLGALRDGPVLVAGVALVRADVLGDVIVRVEDGVQGVHLGELHQRAVGQLARLVKLAAAKRRLEDVQRRHPGAQDHLAPGLREALGDGPAEALVVRDASHESLLAYGDEKRSGGGERTSVGERETVSETDNNHRSFANRSEKNVVLDPVRDGWRAMRDFSRARAPETARCARVDRRRATGQSEWHETCVSTTDRALGDARAKSCAAPETRTSQSGTHREGRWEARRSRPPRGRSCGSRGRARSAPPCGRRCGARWRRTAGWPWRRTWCVSDSTRACQ